jgi:hypothetical protein
LLTILSFITGRNDIDFSDVDDYLRKDCVTKHINLSRFNGAKWSVIWPFALLALILAPTQLCAQTNSTRTAGPSNRYLLIVETSRGMQSRADAVLKSVQDLLSSGMGGQMRQGDTLGVWTFNEELHTGRFPLQQWSSEAQGKISFQTLGFLQKQKYEKQANFAKVVPALERVIKDSEVITIILVSNGEQPIRGTPFDTRINELYKLWQDQQRKAGMPFLTLLRAKRGKLTEFTVNTAPWPVEMPPLPAELQGSRSREVAAPAAQPKAPAPTRPPLIISWKKPAPQPSEPVSTPEPNIAKTEVSPQQTEAVKTQPLPPVEQPSPKSAVLNPQESSAEPKPLSTGAPATATLADSNSAQTNNTSGAAPADPGPPSTDESTQTAITVPSESLFANKLIWLIVAILALVVCGLVVMLAKRRPQTSPRISLITRSLDHTDNP